MANATADHSLRDLVKSLRHESGASQDFHSALDTASKLVRNVLEQPDEPKFRSIRLSNSAFQQRLGRFASGISLLRALGFEDAHGDGESAGPPSHLALPIADPVLLANGLVYLTAAREASDVLIGEQAGRSAPPTTVPSVTSAATFKPPPRRVEAVRSNASGKRPLAAASSASEPQSQDGGGKRPHPTVAGGAANGSSDAGGSGDGGSGVGSNGDGSSGDGGSGVVLEIGTAVELESYSAEAIDAYFMTMAGGPFLEGLSASKTDGATFARLVATARDAKRVAEATHDVAAGSRAQHWVSCLEEQGELLGWTFEEVGEEECEGPLAHGSGSGGAGGNGVGSSGAGSSGAGSSGAGSSGAGSSGAGSSMAAASGSSLSTGAFPEMVNEEPEYIAADGNFDSCSICGQGGLLVCCDVCPQAYHAACLGSSAPPEDEDEESTWFCPPCKEQLAQT